ncbi:MAG: aminotransferase class I/II-fold pyridoxal phosphate-dependent enzyme, partial [Acinetobacter sp.]
MGFIYQYLADALAHRIHSGELQAHHKLPSLRAFAQAHQISLSTAQACYELLEAQGCIYVKPKAGFFVQAQKIRHVPNQPTMDFPSISREVSNFDLQNQIQEASSHAQMIHLGAIQLGADLIPIEALRKSVQRALKHCHPDDFLYCNRQGHPKLREALQQHWGTDGLNFSTSDIYITNGCMASLSLVLQAFSDIGDNIIIPTPTFNGQLQLLASLKRKIIEIPASHQGLDL